MPKLETALFAYLSNEPGVSALVGAGDGARIYPFRLPEPTKSEPVNLPAISWQRISAQREYTLDPFEDQQPWVRARVQFSCWSNSPLEAIALGEAVMLALSGYEGEMSGEYIGSVDAAFELDDYEPSTKLYRRLVDFVIGYEDDL